MHRPQATRHATEMSPLPQRRGSSVVNWVKSGTWLIILAQVGAVNQIKGGDFCAECTKNGHFPPPMGSPDTSSISKSPSTQIRTKKPSFLGNVQRKTGYFTEKVSFSRSKLPFYDINGNKFVIFPKRQKFCATSRNEHPKPPQNPSFRWFFRKKTALFAILLCMFFLFSV